MPKVPQVDIPLAVQLRNAMKSGLKAKRPAEICEIDSLDKRVESILGVLKRSSEKKSSMIFFVMYDIEDNKVRRYIVKYLERLGCIRVQKSIFLADLPVEKYETIRKDLADVQSFYENNDSIIVAPVPADYIRCMSIIGQDVNLDLILRTKNTLFF